MKRIVHVVIVVALFALLPSILLAQDEPTLEGLSAKLEALVELITSMSDRMNSFEDRVAGLEEDELDARLSALETRTAPTPTPKPTPTPEATPTPELTPTPTAIPVPDTVLVVTVARGNARSGPGTQYDILDVVTQGDTLTGPYQETGTWYQFCCVADDELAWISKTLVTVKEKADLTAWETARSAAIEVDGETLLRFNDDYVGELVYFGDVIVIQALDDSILVFLDAANLEQPSWLLYENTSPRIIARDRIDFVARVVSLYTYETAGQGALTVPLLEVIELRVAE